MPWPARSTAAEARAGGRPACRRGIRWCQQGGGRRRGCGGGVQWAVTGVVPPDLPEIGSDSADGGRLDRVPGRAHGAGVHGAECTACKVVATGCKRVVRSACSTTIARCEGRGRAACTLRDTSSRLVLRWFAGAPERTRLLRNFCGRVQFVQRTARRRNPRLLPAACAQVRRRSWLLQRTTPAALSEARAEPNTPVHACDRCNGGSGRLSAADCTSPPIRPAGPCTLPSGWP